MSGLRRSKRIRLQESQSSSSFGIENMDMSATKTRDSRRGTVPLTPLNVPLILTHIFKTLNTRELLKCSLVCKTWNREARYVLRDYKDCVAYTDRESPCESLKHLEMHLRNMSVIPYNGLQIKIEWGHTSSSSCLGAKDMHNFYSCIVNNVRWKKLNINWGGTRGRKKCPAVHLIKLLLEKSEHLEELSMSETPGGEQLCTAMNHTKSEIRFPRLRRLKTNYFPVFEDQPSPILSLFCNLLSAAPNVEELWGEVRPVHLEFLPQKALEAIKELRFFPRSPINPVGYDRLAQAKPQLRSLEALDCDVDNFDDFESTNWESWRRLKPILESSKSSLENFYTDSIVAAVQVRFGIPLMETVTKIQFELDPQVLNQASVRHILRRFFSSFPNLSSVSVMSQEILFDGQVLQFMNWCHDADVHLDLSNGIYPAARELPKLTIAGYTEEVASCLAQVFPSVKSLVVESYDVRHTPLVQLWSHWPDLEDLSISTICFSEVYGLFPLDPPPLQNFDAVFLGIHPEEATMLQRKSAEFLKAVQIVPVQPAITGLKKLRKFRIRLTGHSGYVERIKRNIFFITKLTCLVAFKRMPELQVVIDCTPNMHTRLKRLDRYVTLQS